MAQQKFNIGDKAKVRKEGKWRGYTVEVCDCYSDGNGVIYDVDILKSKKICAARLFRSWELENTRRK